MHPLGTAQCRTDKGKQSKDGAGGRHSSESSPQRGPPGSLQFGVSGTLARRMGTVVRSEETGLSLLHN